MERCTSTGAIQSNRSGAAACVRDLSALPTVTLQAQTLVEKLATTRKRLSEANSILGATGEGEINDDSISGANISTLLTAAEALCDEVLAQSDRLLRRLGSI